MTVYCPFDPDYGNGTGPLTGTGTSQNAVIRRGAKSLRVIATGSGVGYVKTYSSTNTDVGMSTVTTADLPIVAGLVSTITKPEGHDRVAYIGAGLTFYAITGEGF